MWQAGHSESFGDRDPELRLAPCRALPGTRISQQNVLHISSLSYPTVARKPDVVKQSLRHARSCRREAFYRSAGDELSFTSQFHFQDENASLRRVCFKTPLHQQNSEGAGHYPGI